jgi:hypothetical protein
LAIGVISGFWRASLLKAFDVGFVLAGEVRPLGIHAVAVDAMAGDARRGFGLALFGRARADIRRLLGCERSRLQSTQHG